MNQDFDKEIESILRRASRRSAKSPSSDASANTPHMDADELSAYAEGALPDAARTRYMTHLADCDSCRKIVTELVVSQGIEQEKGGQVAQTVEARTGSWREWLTALFSPPVLRYAVPALALFAVIAIALIVARRSGNETSFVAQNEPNKEQQAARPATEESKTTTNTTSTATTANVEDNHENSPAANANTVASNTTTPPATLREAAPAAPTVQEGAAATQAAPKTVDLSKDERTATLNEQQRAAESNKAGPPAPANAPADSVDRMKEKDDGTLAQRKQQSADSALGGGSAAGATNGRRARGAEPSTSTTAPNSTSEERTKNEAARKAPAALGSATRRDSAGDDESSATRTVAGRRFRQQNGVWIDTAYNSSRSLTKVRRDSEQYRALVADEPVIGTVANTLGNVIVVVKGRAYHVY